MIRILYVEDDTTLCQLFEAVMTPRGYDVDVATSGEEGLSKHKANPYDIVALDYQLPDMTGLDIAKDILADDPNLPVLMITGRGNENIAAEALRIGVSNYIVKDSQESYVDLLPSVVLHLERRLEIESIMRKSADALRESQEQSKQQFLTQLDTAERYENQARELASLAEELTVANERLLAFANHDELTGLPNARLCKDRLKIAIATARRSDAEVAFIHVDFDNFKTVNTKIGRHGGDAILRDIAKRLKLCVRDMDTAARLRSDRFGLVVAGLDDRDIIIRVAKRLQASLAAPYEYEGESVPVGTQIGMAIYPEHGSTAEELLSHAELSVHNAEIYSSDADGADAA